MKPLLLRHYRIRHEAETADGEEALVFASERRRLVVNGSSFGEFLDEVVPLLDGSRTLEEIAAQVSGTFSASDLTDAVEVLVESGVVVDAEHEAVLGDAVARPELGYLREVGLEPSHALARLAQRRVTVVGLGAVGITAASALAAAGVGHIRCVDASTVSPSDPFLGQLFRLEDVGRRRTDVAAERIGSVNPATSVESADEELRGAIEGSDFVLCCLDPGLVSIIESLNLAALDLRIPWCSGSASAFEAEVGPTVIPFETACYRCYEDRALACAPDPVDALADLRHRREAKATAEEDRENLPFGGGIVGQLLALQAFQALTGLKPQTEGRILVVDLLTSAVSRHVVLRKPWCPACFPAVEL